MALLRIVKDDDEIIRKKSREITVFDENLARLIDDMKDTLKKSGGVGLAAVQVGVLRRIVLVENEKGKVLELINPEIIDSKGEQEELEGCLSIPEKWGITHRPKWVKVRAVNRKGEAVEYEGKDLTARAFCHELDHLEGKLFTDNAIRMLSQEELEELS